jgi:hypothetical protein
LSHRRTARKTSILLLVWGASNGLSEPDRRTSGPQYERWNVPHVSEPM